MNQKYLKDLIEYVSTYFNRIEKELVINNTSVKFYVSMRGYIKIHNTLSDIKLEHFGKNEYVLFEEILNVLEYGNMPLYSGGLFLKAKDSRLNKNVFYKTKVKLVELEILIPTPFQSYYIVNPKYVVKLTPNKKNDVESKIRQPI